MRGSRWSCFALCSYSLYHDLTDLRSGILARTADEVSATLRHQLRTLDDAKKISKSMPILLEGTEKMLKSVLNSVSSLSQVETAVEDIKVGIQNILGMIVMDLFCLSPFSQADSDFQDNQASEIRSREKHELLQWISKLDFRSKQEDILTHRSPDTGAWLIDDENFQKWFGRDRCCCLWCPGIRKPAKMNMGNLHLTDIFV